MDGIREVCGNEFLLGVRLSPEKFGMDLLEIKELCQRLIDEGKIDFLDISLWDTNKLPEEKEYQNLSLLEHFTRLDFKEVKLTVAGKISTGSDVIKVLDAGVDFVTIGRSAILHHDFPLKVIENGNFIPTELPVSKKYLANEGLSEAFIKYMGGRPNFVKHDK